MFSRDGLVGILQDAGFSSVKVVDAGRRNGVCYEMELVGTKPAADSAGSGER
jgi:hypothetical protein